MNLLNRKKETINTSFEIIIMDREKILTGFTYSF